MNKSFQGPCVVFLGKILCSHSGSSHSILTTILESWGLDNRERLPPVKSLKVTSHKTREILIKRPWARGRAGRFAKTISQFKIARPIIIIIILCGEVDCVHVVWLYQLS